MQTYLPRNIIDLRLWRRAKERYNEETHAVPWERLSSQSRQTAYQLERHRAGLR